MAARKKTAKAKAKRKNVRAGKTAARVKRATAKKKVAKKRVVTRPARAVSKRAAPARRKAPAVAQRPARPVPTRPPAQAVSAVQPAAPAAKPARAPDQAPRQPREAATVPAAKSAPAEERIGILSHYFSHLSVAALLMESGSLRVGDTIHVKGHTTDFTQKVDSLQVDHAPVSEVRSGQDFGVKVKEHAREHDVVYKVIAG
jgi:hypothetical protein